MHSLTRRRFLTLSACAGLGGTKAFAGMKISHWRARALGAQVTLSLAHPEAEQIAEDAFAELRRLEGIFSLYKLGSALSHLNREGRLDAPPFELLECLGLCGRVHDASGGAFDPTIQPIWSAYAQVQPGGTPDPEALQTARALIGWHQVTFDGQEVRFDRPGMAITLNGIAQGYIADRVAGLLGRRGLTDIMVDTGELRAIGGHPEGGGWPVTFERPDGGWAGTTGLRNAAIATSAPGGTRFDLAEKPGHIFDPATGAPTRAPWQLVSVTGPSAAVADGLSTAICLMQDRGAIDAALSAFSGVSLIHLS